MLRSRSQIRDALLLAMASVLAVDSFGPLSGGGGGGGGRLGTARGLLGHLDPSENQVTAATASLDEKKRVLPACGLRAEAASYSSCRKRAYRRACRRAKEGTSQRQMVQCQTDGRAVFSQTSSISAV